LDTSCTHILTKIYPKPKGYC